VDVYRRDVTADVRVKPHPPYESWVEERVRHWRDAAVATEYVAFVEDVAPLITSLPQVLHFGEKIVHLILKHLEVCEIFLYLDLIS
jgi:hypothetical protein